MKEKVAILGGGCGAMTAAYALSRNAEMRERYDVTVYQLGWRLGGKGACARDGRAGYGQRILEHGLHVWAGFYENAFSVMRECYGALDRPPGTPLSVWYDADRPADSAFLPHDCVTVEEMIDGAWQHWVAEIPERDGLPGDGADALPNPWELTKMLMETTVELIQSSILWSGRSGGTSVLDRLLRLLHDDDNGHARKLGAGLAAAIHADSAAATSSSPEPASEPDDAGADLGGFFSSDSHSWLLPAIASVLQRHDHNEEHHGLLAGLVERLHSWLADELRTQQGIGSALRRMWLLADLLLTHIRGILSDGVLLHGFDCINDMDWRAWLKKHGAESSTLDSALVRGIYEYVFGFHEGDPNQPALEAGTATYGILRLTMTYKGSIFWTMQAGMGEVVFTPLYQVMKQRGVKFKFFHRVDKLNLSAQKDSIDSIDLGVQCKLRDPNSDYQPLLNVRGVDAWPDRPLSDQLVRGEQLKDGNIDLESPWSGWQDAEKIQLRKGVDFDRVVLGIAKGALGSLCEELIAHDPAWAQMMSKVETVQTQTLQLWFRPTTQELGWTAPPTILTAYAEPFATWADLSFLEARETWPPGSVGSLAYLCGVLPTQRPGQDLSEFTAQAHKVVYQNAKAWLDRYCHHIWPEATAGPGSPLNYDLLFDPENRQGEARLAAQFMRANVHPSDAYVLSVPGSSACRLEAGNSGFRNLFLAGDWVRTSINAGCVEAAVLSGLSAAAALQASAESDPQSPNPPRPRNQQPEAGRRP